MLGFQLLLGELRPLLFDDHTGRGHHGVCVCGSVRALLSLFALLVVITVVIQLDTVFLQGKKIVFFGLDRKADRSK